MFDQVMLATRTALGLAIADAFFLGMGITLVALLVAVFMKELPLAKTWALPETTAAGVPLDQLGALPVAGSSAALADPPPTSADEPASDGPGSDERLPDPGRPAGG